MKKVNFFIITTFGMMLLGCGQNSQKILNTENGQKQSQTQTEDTISKTVGQTNSIVSNNLEDKFLITSNSLGFFKIGGTWQDFAKNNYNYQSVEGYGSCTDACCDGGFLLGNKIIDGEYGKTIDDPQLTIGALSFDESASENKHKGNSNVFYVSSDNCQGWYWKDKINYIIVYSDLFKTKEEVGVGTTLEKAEAKFGKLHFYVGWIEEDGNALQVVIKSYPNISFILDIGDYKGKWEDISLTEDKNSMTIADFKKNTKIQRLIIHRKN